MQNGNAGATKLYSYNRRTTYNKFIFCHGIHLKLSSHFPSQALYKAQFENPKFPLTCQTISAANRTPRNKPKSQI